MVKDSIVWAPLQNYGYVRGIISNFEHKCIRKEIKELIELSTTSFIMYFQLKLPGTLTGNR